MFAVRCELLGSEVLITPSAVREVVNTDEGLMVLYRCWCGREAVLVTGAGVAEHARHLEPAGVA